MQTNNNPMWIALTVLGGIVAYSMLRKDTLAVADKVGDGVVYVADKANPLSQKNIVNSVITATGEAVTGGGEGSWSLGTQLNKWFAKDGNYDWQNPTGAKPKTKSTQPTAKLTTAKNHRGAAYSSTQKTGMTDTSPNILAKNFNGQWKKLINGKWLPLTKSDKVFQIRGVNVVHHHTWKPS